MNDPFAGMEVFTSLQALLPPDQMVVADTEQRMLVLTSRRSSNVPPVVQRFSRSEWRVLLALLRVCPAPCTCEQLAATAYGTSLHPQAAVRPLRVTISRLRPKLAPFALDVTSLVSKGYAITANDLCHR